MPFSNQLNAPPSINLPCGGEAEFDHGSGIGFRCMDCNAMVGSIGMPRSCKDLLDLEQNQEKVMQKLRGRR